MLVGAARQLRVHVSEIGVDNGVRVPLQRHQQSLARRLQPSLQRVEHREVVVRLEHVGVLVPQRLEDFDGLSGPPLVRAKNSVQKARLRIDRFVLQHRPSTSRASAKRSSPASANARSKASPPNAEPGRRSAASTPSPSSAVFMVLESNFLTIQQTEGGHLV